MQLTSIYQKNIYEGFSALLSVNIFSGLEKIIMEKIEQATLTLKGSIPYLDGLDETQAKEMLKSLMPYTAKLNDVKDQIHYTDIQNQELKTVVLDFINVVEQIEEILMDKIELHYPYKMSHEVLAEDWDSDEDDIWDEY